MKNSTKLKIALRHLLSRPFQMGAIILAITFTTALACFLFVVSAGFRQGLVSAVEPFEIVVGAKGSPYQLLLSAVYLQDSPIGNIPWANYVTLSDDSRVSFAVPVAMGDSYRGLPIIGSTEQILKIKTQALAPEWFKIKEGRMFETAFETVLGSHAAETTSLKIGDTFYPSHGAAQGKEAHKQLYTVVGIAENLQGPYDRAIFTPIESVWKSHPGDEVKHDGETNDDKSETQGDVTAIWVHPSSYFGAYSLAIDLQNDQWAQLIFPAQATLRLFSVMGQGEKFLSIIVWTVLGVTVLITMLVLYWTGSSRTQERTLLRILGASRKELLAIAWLESFCLISAGVLWGWTAGRIAGIMLFDFLKGTTSFQFSVALSWEEFGIAFVLLLAGSIAGIVPAYLNNCSILEKLLDKR